MTSRSERRGFRVRGAGGDLTALLRLAAAERPFTAVLRLAVGISATILPKIRGGWAAFRLSRGFLTETASYA